VQHMVGEDTEQFKHGILSLRELEELGAYSCPVSRRLLLRTPDVTLYCKDTALAFSEVVQLCSTWPKRIPNIQHGILSLRDLRLGAYSCPVSRRLLYVLLTRTQLLHSVIIARLAQSSIFQSLCFYFVRGFRTDMPSAHSRFRALSDVPSWNQRLVGRACALASSDRTTDAVARGDFNRASLELVLL